MSKIGVAARAALVAIVCASAAPAAAQPSPERLIGADLIAELRAALQSPVSLILLKAQNARHKDLTQDQVDALDKQWRAETKADAQPLIAQLYGNPLSAHLTRMQADSDGLYTEIFVMDGVGLNVGQSSVTSDYWQGDEAKWQKTYLVGPDAVFIDEAEFDKGTQAWRAQVNLSIADPDSGEVLGAATVEINLTDLARRQGVTL